MTQPAPPPPILRITDAIVARLRDGFDARLKTVAALAGELDDKTFEKIKADAPSILVCLAAARPSGATDELVLDLQWGVYCISRRLQSPSLTLRGTKLEIGAVEIFTHAHALLVGKPIDYAPAQSGLDQKLALGFVDMDDLFEATFAALGLFVYGVRYQTERVRIVDPGFEPGTAGALTPFQTFAADHVRPPVPAGAVPPIAEPPPANVNLAGRDRLQFPQE